MEVWRDIISKGAEKQKAPYMSHQVGGDVSRVEFCPFEDCLGIGHANGFSSIIVPGMCNSEDWFFLTGGGVGLDPPRVSY